MLAQLSLWILAATVGQAPPEAAWLKAVPADVDVALRSRGLDATRDDLMGMLKAMSPALADQAAPALADQLDQFRQKYGDPAVKTRWISLMRVAEPGPGGSRPFAVLVRSDDYRGVLQTLKGGKAVELKPQPGGYDAFDGPQGEGTWYAVKGAGFVAFGPDKTLVAAVARPGKKTLDQALTPALRERFFAGDVGVYVNAATLATRYADQIDQARQQFMAALDQAGEKGGNAAAMGAAKRVYGGLFDAVKYADALTLDLDFAAEGLRLAGALTVKPDSAAAKSVANARTGPADDLARLDGDAALFIYMNMDSRSLDRLSGLSLRMLNAGGKPTPAEEQARAQFRGLGPVETSGSVSFRGGIRGLNVIHVADPVKYVAAAKAMTQALKGSTGPLNIYKDIKVDSDAEKHRGFTFTHLVLTVDQDKLAKLNEKDPNSAAGIKSVLAGSDSTSTWLGTDGKRVVQVTTPNWDDARARLDAFLDGKDSIGARPGYRAVRSRLPERAGVLALVSAQGLVRLIATQAAAGAKRPELKAPDDLPAEPALFGFSLTPRPPAAYEFRLVLPSPAGAVFEKGLVPLLQGLQAKPQP